MNGQKVTSNVYFPATEGSESCFAQPKPRALGRESSLYGHVQRESLPPLEKLKVSAGSTANGVQSLHEQPPTKDVASGKDVADPAGATEKAQPLKKPEDPGPPQAGGQDTPGAERKADVEAVMETQPIKENAEVEPLGTEGKGQPLQTAGEGVSPGAVGGTENVHAAGEVKPLGTAENIPPLETTRDLQPEKAMGKDEQSPLLETIPKENEPPEELEGNQFVESAEQSPLQETLGKDEQSQLLEAIPDDSDCSEILEGSQFVEAVEDLHLQRPLGRDEPSRLLDTVPKKNEPPDIVDRSQLGETPVMNDPLQETPEGPGNMGQIPPEGTEGSKEYPAGIVETEANVETFRKTPSKEEDQHIEGETGEKMETEMRSEKVSEGAETKEEETGEAVDLSAAT
ncbi:hypothetical protein TREES_T100013415 [Tupaia chinensis]|uniref:Glutamate-rich protein 5 n=1 Tax=Tupaia chinensis TaxID=246437 RepID=L9JA78_TUPCH|nr:hypothetical protein TREES_T100013415 [Tupaia chinensis]